MAGVFNERLAALLQEALQALPDEDSALRARLLAQMAVTTYFTAPRQQRLDMTEEAVEMARRTGDKSALAIALGARHQALWELDNLEERLAVAAESLALAEEVGDKDTAAFARYWLIVDHLEAGDIAAMKGQVQAYTQMAEELRQPGNLWNAALLKATVAFLEGRLQECEQLAQQALAIGQRGQAQNAVQFFAVQLFGVRREQGRLQEIEPAIKGFVEQYPLVPAWRTGLAYIYAELGREAETREQFETLAADDFAPLPYDANWPVGAVLLSEACAFLGDTRRAPVLYERLLPHASRWVNVGAAALTNGCISRNLGLLATTMGRWEDAERHLQYALESNAKGGAPIWVAWTHLNYGDMLLRRDAEGDRQQALEHINAALDIAQEAGIKPLTDRALALKLKAQGIESTGATTSIDAVAKAVYVEKPDLQHHAAPDGTVTIMFSDIEGSTEMAERLGDERFMAVLREHNAIVREQVKAQGGFEVKSEGDGFMVAFQSARRALDCAIAIQRALAERNEKAEEPVRVRMGLHAGETIKEGEDFFGRNVILAARIASQAVGGEILVSGLLKALVESAGGVAFGEMREVELRGLSGRHEIWPALWAA